MEIIKYEKINYDQLMDFLSNVSSLQSIEEELFENSLLVIEEDEVVGMISYESFRGRSLIRYFIFAKEVEHEVLVILYEQLIMRLKENGIDRVFVIVHNDTVREMFTGLGFIDFNKDEFFLNEENIMLTKYHDAEVMVYTINSEE